MQPLSQYGGLSYLIKERLFLSEAPLAVLVGVVLERSGAIPVELAGKPGSGEDPLDHFALELSRLVIGIQVRRGAGGGEMDGSAETFAPTSLSSSGYSCRTGTPWSSLEALLSSCYQ